MKYATTGALVTHVVISAPSSSEEVVFERILEGQMFLKDTSTSWKTLVESSIRVEEYLAVPTGTAEAFFKVLQTGLTHHVGQEMARRHIRYLQEVSFGAFLEEVLREMKISPSDL